MTVDLRGRVVAVLGGNGREVEIVRQLIACGAAVRTYGLPSEGAEEAGTPPAATVTEAVAGSEIVICPVPLPEADGSIYAPASPAKIVINTESLRGMRPGGILVTGRASSKMTEAAAVLGLRVREYEQDADLMLLRAPAIAEGAIRLAIEKTDITLHRSACMVVGFGKIGPVMAKTLLGLGARVTVAARAPIQLAGAWALGCDTVHLRDFPERVSEMAVIFNTVPARLFTRDVLARITPRSVLIDMSGPPGAIDFAAARDLGIRAFWARGLGGRAPRTVGQSQWLGISRILTEELQGQASPSGS